MKMMNYQKSKTGTSTNWWKTLEELYMLQLAEIINKNDDYMTNKKWENAVDKAGDWVTCACGNQCSIIPRIGNAPIDGKLYTLGLEFPSAIADGDFLGAMEILHKIEERSCELIQEIIKNQELNN